MSNNYRKLLPYEHQLVQTLGITEEQYLEFALQQQEYIDAKEGTVFDVRNDLATIAIILTVIGTVMQVVAALLPKPSSQSAQARGQRQQTRDDIFAPRFGFNTVQDLAKYGDPVNLIYTNTATNSSGGVRVATSLIWSSVKSFGSSQYVQMLLLLGAGGIGAIDYQRAAFGQTPLRDLIAQNYWLYFRPNSTGAITGNDLKAGGRGESDPAASGVGSRNLYRIVPSSTTSAGDGFSYALSPAVSNKFGNYSPVPINVNIIIRNEAGKEEEAANQITASMGTIWGAGAPSATLRAIPVGTVLTITLASTATASDEEVKEEANEQRRALSSAFDNAAIFKLGSAQFSLVSVNRGSTDEGNMVATLRCIEAGRAPSVSYGSETAKETAQTVANSDDTYIELSKQVEALLKEDERDGRVISGPGLLGTFGGQAVNTAADLLKAGNIAVRVKTGATEYFSLFTGQVESQPVYGLKLKRRLTTEEKNILKAYIQQQEDIKSGAKSDDYFFIKALVKIEKANYETISPCHIVDLALKARVFRRISGRQEKYGSKEIKGYAISDNGIKLRTSMFALRYRQITDKKPLPGFTYVKGIFVVRRAADNDNFIYLRFNSGQTGAANASNWQFELEPIHDPVSEFAAKQLEDGSSYPFFYLENSGRAARIDLGNGRSMTFTGRRINSSNMFPPLNNSPRLTNEWDLFSNTADTQYQTSFDNGPEFTLTAVTEQVVEPFTNFRDVQNNLNLYHDISLIGFNLYSGRNVQDLRSLSVFVTQGRRSRLLRTSGTVNGVQWGGPNYQYLSPTANGYANTAPDIFIDTILDANDGIGKYAGNSPSGTPFSVDIEQLARSKKFCERNGLFMDGVIAEPSSWREFWSVNAAFSLLELAKRDGQDTLLPAVPYNPGTGEIIRTVNISALFNPGNILEDSYKEEFIDYGSSTEDVIITAVYRDNEPQGVFPRNNSVEVYLTRDGRGAPLNADLAMRETIDLSRFVTRREQAIMVAKYLCQVKRHSRRAIEFKTFPTDSFVAPGAYIYVELAQNQWNGIQTGSIGPNGTLNLPLAGTVKNGSYQFLLYNPNATTSGTVSRNNVTVSGNRAASLKSYEGYIFVLGTAIKNKRVFKVTEVAMDEEGEVTVRAVEHGVDDNGLSLISNGLASRVAGLFTIDGRPE